VICGGISRYNATGELPGPKNYFNLVFRRARMEGFIVIDYADRFDDATRQMREWIDAGKITQQVTVVEGFEELPRSLIKLFEGFNTGKLMVKTH
jgi:NADPH-dependent curcumin reductase CurA